MGRYRKIVGNVAFEVSGIRRPRWPLPRDLFVSVANRAVTPSRWIRVGYMGGPAPGGRSGYYRIRAVGLDARNLRIGPSRSSRGLTLLLHHRRPPAWPK